MLTQPRQTESDIVAGAPRVAERPSTRAWLMERIDVRVAIAVGVAWLALTQIAAWLEPAPQRSEPFIGVILVVTLDTLFVATLIGLGMRRRWGLVASLAGAVLATAAAVACPTSGHHQFGTWWYGEMACVLALVAVSVGSRYAVMTTLDDLMAVAQAERSLMVVSTIRADATIQSSLVNAGVLRHPVTGDEVVAFVTYGATKLRNLRVRPQITLTARSGWQWATVEGTAELIGPDDPNPGVDGERLRLLLREVFTAAGGTHDDWDAYDAEMAAQHRTVVLVVPARIYSN